MSYSIAHTIRLQDGSLCNLNKRIAKHAIPLLEFLSAITDPRSRQGRRHCIGLILFIVFIALLRNSKDLKDAHLYAVLNQHWLGQYFDLRHGIPDPTTISRLLQATPPDDLVAAGLQFFAALNIPLGEVLSFDGKTIRAITAEDAIRHMLSFFSHDSQLTLGQIGVSSKENEIPAAQRLLEQAASDDTAVSITAPICSVAGKLLLGDALHTQKATVKVILKARADYLLVAKGNQRKLLQAIQTAVQTAQAAETDETKGSTNCHSYSYTTTDRKRSVTTTVTTITAAVGQELLPSLRRSDHWDGVQTMGILRRTGTRTSKDGTVTPVNETIGFISSRELTAEQVATYLRAHWGIENKLHWVKDVVFGEDRHTLRKGNAPQIMSFLRSLAISICHILKVKSISDVLHNLEKSPELHHRFLKLAAIV